MPVRISGSAVFDAWAILAWLRDEPSASRVDEILRQAADGDLQLSMSWINAGEAYYMLVRKRSQQAAEEFLRKAARPSDPARPSRPRGSHRDVDRGTLQAIFRQALRYLPGSGAGCAFLRRLVRQPTASSPGPGGPRGHRRPRAHPTRAWPYAMVFSPWPKFWGRGVIVRLEKPIVCPTETI